MLIYYYLKSIQVSWNRMHEVRPPKISVADFQQPSTVLRCGHQGVGLVKYLYQAHDIFRIIAAICDVVYYKT